MKRLALIAVLCLSLLSIEGSADEYGYMSGIGLLAVIDKCEDEFEYCLVAEHYVVGVYEVLFLNGRQSDESRAKNLFRVCKPKLVLKKQMTMVVAKYLRDHPEETHSLGVLLVMTALSEAWPCPRE